MRKVNTSLAKLPQQALVVGSGSIGVRHLQVIKQCFAECQLASVPSRINPHYQQPLADHCYASLEDALAAQSYDFVVVASPATLHRQHASVIAKQQTALLIEKPLTQTGDHSQALVDNLYGQSLVCRLGYCLRLLPHVEKIKQLLASRKLGKVIAVSAKVGQYLPEWRANKDYRQSVSAQQALGGGALLELSHEFDLLNYLLGPFTLKQATLINSGTLGIDVEEVAHMSVAWPNGAIGQIEQSFLLRTSQRQLTITGSLGTLHWDLLTNTLNIKTDQHAEQLTAAADWHNSQIYTLQLKAFWQTILGGQTELATLQDGLFVNQFIDSCKAAAN